MKPKGRVAELFTPDLASSLKESSVMWIFEFSLIFGRSSKIKSTSSVLEKIPNPMAKKIKNIKKGFKAG